MSLESGKIQSVKSVNHSAWILNIRISANCRCFVAIFILWSRPWARRPGHNPLSGEWLVLKLPGGDPRNLIFISRADLRQTLAEALKNFKLNRRGQFLFHVRLAQNVNRICGQDFEFWKYGLRIFWLWTSANILIAIIKDFIKRIVLMKMSLIPN